MYKSSQDQNAFGHTPDTEVVTTLAMQCISLAMTSLSMHCIGYDIIEYALHALALTSLVGRVCTEVRHLYVISERITVSHGNSYWWDNVDYK